MDNKELKSQRPSDGYEAPQASRLSDSNVTSGATICGPGSGNTPGPCTSGSHAGSNCNSNGNTPFDACVTNGNGVLP